MRRLAYIVVILFFAVSCIEDKSNYNYIKTIKVTFVDQIQGYTFVAGETVDLVAPITFSEEVAEQDIDKLFEITWWLDGEKIAEGYKITHTFKTAGGSSLVVKVINRETGETYLSESMRSTTKNAVSWGWIALSERDNNASSLSFIHPVSFNTIHNLESDIPEGLGTGPKGLEYYFVDGSIPSSYISGLAKLIVNQSSGTVTLDGAYLQKDRSLADEFQNGTEPEEDLTITGFAWKETFYLISSAEGNLYMRYLSSEFAHIPYYGTYSNMPYPFEGGAKISCFQGFQNVSRFVRNETLAIMYDELNGRFLAFTPGNWYDKNNPDPYKPVLIEFQHYDETQTFSPDIPKVNDMGADTKCLAIGAYESETYSYTDEESGEVVSQGCSVYAAVVDLGGNGNYQLYRFDVSPLSYRDHTIVGNSMYPIDGPMSPNTVIKMSSDFSRNPYFYYTDGDKKLYAYSMELNSSKLIYEAPSKIVTLASSPLDCEFASYGGNSTAPNWRLAVGQSDGNISILDVRTKNMTALFDNIPTDIVLKTVGGFGDIKDIVWATNYTAEF